MLVCSGRLKGGEKFADHIETSIRVYDKLLVLVSLHSIASTWVENEVRAALEKEERFKQEQGLDKTMLFPIKLDSTIEQARPQWAAQLRRQRHILDFTGWKNHDTYQTAFQRLLNDLKAEPVKKSRDLLPD
jgi:TIR domain